MCVCVCECVCIVSIYGYNNRDVNDAGKGKKFYEKDVRKELEAKCGSCDENGYFND